jgi:antitoxin MazE
MIARIQKWGNSLGVRIPKNFAQDARMEEGSSVQLSVEEGRLIIAPRNRRRYNLKELVDKITPENMHGETDWGPPVGKEAW